MPSDRDAVPITTTVAGGLNSSPVPGCAIAIDHGDALGTLMYAACVDHPVPPASSSASAQTSWNSTSVRLAACRGSIVKGTARHTAVYGGCVSVAISCGAVCDPSKRCVAAMKRTRVMVPSASVAVAASVMSGGAADGNIWPFSGASSVTAGT